VAEAVPLVAANLRYAAPLYALGLRVEADLAELARARRAGQPLGDDGTATTLLDRLDQAATSPAAAGLPDLAAWQASAMAERTRQQGRPDPAAWAAAAAAWERLGQPYHLAYAGYRHAEALLAATGDRDTAHQVLSRAAAITGRLGARPLDSEIQALARRARLDLTPPAGAPATAADVPGPAAQLGLIPREVEVLRWWRLGAATARSPRRCSSAPRPSACTSPTSSPSWGWPGGWRRPRSPTAWAWTEAGRRRAVVAGRRSGVAVAGAGAGWSATAARDWWASGSAVVLTPRAGEVQEPAKR
jgi:hypothetical protein